ncbi:MAG: ribosomal protein S18-alanine N-acetyltransferase [Firmicutes bacterium]|nr:ribosomal protein S18-alanine N-acetyltransferase [Bacillota bacterium]
MQVSDLDAVLAIEKLCFPMPWSRFAFQTELTQNHYALYIVGKIGGQIVAYAGAWIILDEAHITNVAVHPDWQGRGLGREILLALLARAKVRGATRATLEVRKHNTQAQRLYRKYGFYYRGVRPGYYTDTGEDALIMWKDSLDDVVNQV